MKYFRQIKVFEPATDAIDRTKKILFRDFDIAVWFTMGFSAWLAGFGGGFSFRADGLLPDFQNHTGKIPTETVANEIRSIDPKDMIIAAVVIAIVIVAVVFKTWLSSRGKFMLMHCVAKNVAEIKRPWREYKLRANSLFRFKLTLGFISTIFFTIIATASWLLLFKNYPSFLENGFNLTETLYFTGISVISILVFTPLILAVSFTDLFVLPIMYKHNLRCSDGWRYFLSLLKFNKWNFVKFCFGMIVINMLVSFAVLALVIVTCCLFACLTMLPYIGTVALLPVIIFYRSYSAIYLAQYGEELNALDPIPDTDEIEPTISSE